MFNFTEAMERLITHISETCPEFAHVEPERMLVSHIRTRSPGIHGVYASCQPLRFENGERTTKRRERTFSMPEVVVDGSEILYIVYFALPRFMNLDFETKLTTVFHELYHIGPTFNGDLRRFPGKNYAHGHSRKVFNDRVRVFSHKYLMNPEALEYTTFLNGSFKELEIKYGSIVGTYVRPPKPRLVG